MWASLASPSGTIAPGQQVALLVRLAWVPMSTGWPASADITVASNDPLRPTVTISARMLSAAAPHSLRFVMVNR
jgi:hypothetical protein